MLPVPRALRARSTYMALIRVWLGDEVPCLLGQQARGAVVMGHVGNI